MIFDSLASFILRQRVPILALIVLVTGGMGWWARYAEMSYQPGQLLPDDEQVYQEYQEFRRLFGDEANVIFLAIEAPDFREKYARRWIELEQNIRNIADVQWTLSLFTTPRLVRDVQSRSFVSRPVHVDELLKDSCSFYGLLDSLPIYEEILWNGNRDVFMMMASLDPKVVNSRNREGLIEQIEREIQYFESGTRKEVHVSGLPFIRTDTIRRSKREIVTFSLLAALVSSIVLLFIFRSGTAIAVPLVVVGVAVIWSSGLLVLLGYQITTLTGLIPSLMIVIGMPNSVYMITKYHLEILQHGNKIKGLTRVIGKTGRSIFVTNLTTAIGFGTLAITRSKLLEEFGILAALSVLTLFGLSLLLVPILLSFQRAPRNRHLAHLKRKRTGLFYKWLTMITARKRRWVYAFCSVFVVVSILGMLRIQPSGKISDDIPRHSRTYRDLEFFEEKLGGVIPFEVTVDCGKSGHAGRDLSFWKKVDQLQDSLETIPEISRPMSLIEFVKAANQALYANTPEAYVLPSRMDLGLLASHLGKSESEGPQQMLVQAYMDSSRSVLRVQARMRDVGTYRMHEIRERMQNMASSVFEDAQIRASFTGVGVVMLQATDYLVKNLFSSLLLAVFLIAAIMVVTFRSLKMALISVIPNLIPLLFTAGVMGWFGIPLKASTSLIFPIAFGISVDDTIHFLSKYRQELKSTHGLIRPSVYRAILETSLSMAYTSVILFFGFSIFIASEFGGTVALGILVSMTLLAAMITNLTLLPSLLISVQKKEIDNNYKKYTNIED